MSKLEIKTLYTCVNVSSLTLCAEVKGSSVLFQAFLIKMVVSLPTDQLPNRPLTPGKARRSYLEDVTYACVIISDSFSCHNLILTVF